MRTSSGRLEFKISKRRRNVLHEESFKVVAEAFRFQPDKQFVPGQNLHV